MVAVRELEFVRETVRELDAQGQRDRARAIESVLVAAVCGTGIGTSELGPDYLTTGQAASALAVSRQTNRRWLAEGRLQGREVGMRTLIHRDAVSARLDELAKSSRPPRERSPEEIRARMEWHEYIVSGIPSQVVERLEALHEKMEDGQRLSRSDRAEMETLEKEMAAAAARRIEDWIAQRSPDRPS